MNWIEYSWNCTHLFNKDIYIKSDSKYIYNVENINFLNNCYPFELFVRQTITLCKYIKQHNNSVHLYSAFLGTQSALHRMGGISSTTTNVQHSPWWCDGSHIAPERPPHTSLLVERRQSDEANQCMGMISDEANQCMGMISDEANQCMGMIKGPWWSEANGRIWPGCRGHTSTLLRRTSWDF